MRVYPTLIGHCRSASSKRSAIDCTSSSFPQALLDRMTTKQGRAHTFDRFEPNHTGAARRRHARTISWRRASSSRRRPHRAVVPNVNRLAATLRDHGGLVVWIQQQAADWPAYAERYRGRISGSAASARPQPGAFGYELWTELDVRADDHRLAKKRFSAFTSGSSDLEERLRGQGVDTVLVTGVATNICCDSTARDAMMAGFRSVMISDGCGTVSDAEHAAALEAFYLYFGDVQTTDEAMARLEGAAAAAAAE